MRSDIAGLKEGNISDEVLNMTQAVTQAERDAFNLTQAERVSRLEENMAENMQFKATFEDSLATVVSASHLAKLIRKAETQAKSIKEKYLAVCANSQRAQEIRDGLEISESASLHCIRTTEARVRSKAQEVSDMLHGERDLSHEASAHITNL